MTHAHRRKLPVRHWSSPAVDQLERRELLNATPVAHLTFVPVHVEVAGSTVHAAKAAHSSVPHAVKAVAKAPHVATHNPFIDVIRIPGAVKRGQVVFSPPPGAFGPAPVRSAYGVTSLGLANQGQGQTIGIVDEFNDPNILADANTFSTQYGLQKFNVAGGPTLTVLKDQALGGVPDSPVQNGFDVGTTIETSLDVEWAHAMAPRANILLVEVPAASNGAVAFGQLLHGVQLAATQGASVVSLSYGFPETNLYKLASNNPNLPLLTIGLPGVYLDSQTYLNSGAATQVAVTVSTGDSSTPLFPASSPNVIGVGGTALHVTSNGAYSFETAWGGTAFDGAGGGGTTAFFAPPTFQSGNGLSNPYRSLPDVSLLADPATGVAVYDSYGTGGGNPWNQIGGTSLSAPLFAGMLSIVQQDRVAASKPILTSAQINAADYALYNSPNYLTYFHDVTQGSNSFTGFDPFGRPLSIAGHSTSRGYDQATGIGSPIANTLVPYLASL
jgi:subtilase family serine protease